MAPRILAMVACSLTRAMRRNLPWQREHITSMPNVRRSSSLQAMYLDLHAGFGAGVALDSSSGAWGCSAGAWGEGAMKRRKALWDDNTPK